MDTVPEFLVDVFHYTSLLFGEVCELLPAVSVHLPVPWSLDVVFRPGFAVVLRRFVPSIAPLAPVDLLHAGRPASAHRRPIPAG